MVCFLTMTDDTCKYMITKIVKKILAGKLLLKVQYYSKIHGHILQALQKNLITGYKFCTHSFLQGIPFLLCSFCAEPLFSFSSLHRSRTDFWHNIHRVNSCKQRSMKFFIKIMTLKNKKTLIYFAKTPQVINLIRYHFAKRDTSRCSMEIGTEVNMRSWLPGYDEDGCWAL